MRKAELSILLVCLLLASELPVSFSPPPPTYTIYISTASLPSGVVGSSYQGNLQALYTGAIPMPLDWKVYSGSLPPGLSLASTGFTTASVSGTPTQAGSWTFIIEAYKDFWIGGTHYYIYDRKQFTIDIAAAPPTEFDFSISVNPTIQAVDINNVIYGNEARTITLGISVSLLGGTTRDVTVSVLGVTMVRGESPVSTIEEGDGIGTRIIPEVGTPPFWSKLVVSITPRILAHMLQSGSARVGVTVMGAGGGKLRFATAYLDLVYQGDLSPIGLEPVQVLFGETLIADKSTVFRVTINSTFWYPVKSHIWLDFIRGWSWSVYTTTSPVEIPPGVSWIYIPLEQDLVMSAETGWYVSVAPRAPDCEEIVMVDPLNQIEEHSESNNNLQSAETVSAAGTLRLCYLPVMFYWEASTSYGSQALVDEWIQDVEAIAQQGSEFVLSTFPIPYLFYQTSTVPFYYVPYEPRGWVYRRTGEFANVGQGPQIDNAEEWSDLSDWDKACCLALLYNQLTAAAWLAGYDRAVGLIPPLWFATYFPYHKNPGNIVGMAWPANGKGAVLIVRRIGGGVVVSCVVAHEIAHTYGVGEKYNTFTMQFSVRSGEGFWVSRFLPISAADFWSFMDFYNSGVDYWVDSDTYQTLTTSIISGDPEVIAIRGLALSNGTVFLEPFHMIEGGAVDMMPGSAGTHYVVLLGSDGTVLARAGFNLTFSALIDPIGRVSFDVIPFAFRLLWDNRTRTIEIRDAHGRVLARRLVSLNPPVVNVTFPAQGDTLTATPRVRYNLTWSASDPDGDALSYSVLYSPDNGTTWFTLATDIWSSYFVLNMAGFTPSNASVIRVVSSDGVNIGTGECRFKVAAITSSYVVQVQPQGTPSSCQVSISVDGTPVAKIQGGFSKTFAFAVGTSHVIAVDDVVSGEMGIRYCLVNNSLRVSGPGICRFAYSTEYFLDVKSEYGVTAGSGWHTRNENVTFSVTQEGSAGGALGLLGVKYKFRRWSGHSNATTPSATVIMNGPKEVVAVMELDYTVPASVALAGLLVAGGIWFALKRRQRPPPAPP